MNSNENLKREYNKTLDYFKEINLLSPFPIVDTDDIKSLEKKINENNIDYDLEPVTCCSHCKTLYIVTDEYDNDYCVLCKNSINEIEVHKTIFHYLNKYKDK